MKKLVLAATVSAVALSSAAFAGGPVVVKPEPVPAPPPPAVHAPSSAEINPAVAGGLGLLALLALAAGGSDDDATDSTPTSDTPTGTGL